MCGIAGVMTKTGNVPESSILDLMEAALLHRGPDGSGRDLHGDTVILQHLGTSDASDNFMAAQTFEHRRCR